MRTVKNSIIRTFCVCILVIISCCGCNQQRQLREHAVLSGDEAAVLLFEYIFPGMNYYESADFITNPSYDDFRFILPEDRIEGEYKFSLPEEGKNHFGRIIYYGLIGDYHIFDYFTEEFDQDYSGNNGFINSELYSGFAVNKITEKIVQERYADSYGTQIYSIKYFVILNQSESWTSSIMMEINEDGRDGSVLTGKDGDGNEFHINLDYSMTDIVLKDSYYVDFTEDGNPELCIELNIFNTVASDMNTILVYDLEKRELLFPNQEKPFIYDGEAVILGDTKAILYKNFAKINKVGIESEYSALKWNGNDFETMVYYRKLLVETDKYAFFYENTDETNETNIYQLTVLDRESLELMGDVKVALSPQTDIVKSIDQEVLVIADTTGSNEIVGLYFEDSAKILWNGQERRFQPVLQTAEEKTFEMVPLSYIEDGIERIYFSDELGFYPSPNAPDGSLFATYVCYPKYKGNRDRFIKEYLEARGMYKDEPDGINERYGKRCSEYYINEEKQRVSIIVYKDWYKDIKDENGDSYPDCIYFVTVDMGKLELQGYLASTYDENGEITSQRSYDSDEIAEAYISYEYNPSIPFPIIVEYEEYVKYPHVGINNTSYHKFYKEDMKFDESGRWIGYKTCFLCGQEYQHNNVCEYNSQGKLKAIREILLEEDKKANYNKDYSGEILLEYNEGGIPVSSDYWGSSTTHRIGSGISGNFEYDDMGRVISWSFISGDIYFIYSGDNRYPWARIRIGGNPYSSHGVEDGIAYGHNTYAYLFLSE